MAWSLLKKFSLGVSAVILVLWATAVGWSETNTGVVATIGMVGVQPNTETPTPEPAMIIPQLRIRINIPATKLEVYKDNVLAKTFPISVGMLAHKSPVMHNQLTQLIWNPSWIPPPDSDWAIGLKTEPPGPRNPLGPVKMPLEQGIRIHGTTKDSSIGRAASHGCFRMHNKDASALAWFIQQNDSDKTDDSYRESYAKNRHRTHVVNLLQPVEVDIVYEPVEVANKTLYIHPDIYGWAGKRRDLVLTAVSFYGITENDIQPEFWQRVKLGGKKGTQEFPLEELITPPHNDTTQTASN
ncbi:MAG: hypothetical protein COV45_04015 [Deltaproteobacteria bacterium CG11_big_fil_rev_8_21_14_0_20_47_16]|nr:MAG: hypothetical protein COV45_04015 [Deltaproteobacteria bacterium CG11_big_fil_rev_8_21_14_0_20_47_16]